MYDGVKEDERVGSSYNERSLRDDSQRLLLKKVAATYSPTGVQYHRRKRA